ncbi:FMN-binding protein [Sporolactobacillus sp. THM7-4]|nr:FMN-binding protein [Sporolactobacillus sp. THM7-4]
MAKLSPKWIALCTATIGLAYTAGYVVTEPKTSAVPAAAQSHIKTGINGADNKDGQNSSNDESPSAKKSTRSTETSRSPSGSSTAKNQSGYKDGSYTGSGMNRIGSVSVSVTIRNGKIASVQITDCTTSYPQSEIDQLPSQVKSRQSANVDNVSGATESTDDFRTAVLNALSQAKA